MSVGVAGISKARDACRETARAHRKVSGRLVTNGPSSKLCPRSIAYQRVSGGPNEREVIHEYRV
jgi:hypothetical protein